MGVRPQSWFLHILAPAETKIRRDFLMGRPLPPTASRSKCDNSFKSNRNRVSANSLRVCASESGAGSVARASCPGRVGPGGATCGMDDGAEKEKVSVMVLIYLQ